MVLELADLSYLLGAAIMVMLLTLMALEWAKLDYAFMSMKKRLTNEIEALRGKVEEQELDEKKLASLSLKVEEQLISDDVTEMNSQTSQLVFDLQELTKIMSGIEAKLGILESKQDETLSLYWQLCQALDVEAKTSTKV